MEAVIPIERVVVIFSGRRVFAVKIIITLSYNTGVTAQNNPPDWTIPGYNLDYTLGIVCELPDYTPGYTVGAPRVYPTSPDYTPPDSGWGIVWAIGVYSGRYRI